MIKAIIFDCFGVLIGKGFDHTYRVAGGEPDRDRDFIEDALSKANLGQIKDDQFHTSIAEKLELTISEWRTFTENAEQINVELLHYILELKNNYKTAILSNANIGVLENRIGKKQLNKTFDEIVVSAEVGIVKPNPEIYLLLCKKLNVNPDECIYIDDRLSFVESAKTLGMLGHLYGNFHDCKTDIETDIEKY